jgi:DNA-binding LacI/PurR family transcriptional regulator
LIVTTRISQRDIANKLGISQQAVSFAINGRPGVNDKTRRRILRTAKEMGYRPNASARAIRQGSFGSVALLLSSHRGRSYMPDGMLDGIHDALAGRDTQLTVTRLPDEKLTDTGYVPRILRELSVDGLLINYTRKIPPALLGLIEDYRLPAVWLNRKHEHDCVYPDDMAMGSAAAEHLLGLGHRRVAYVDWGSPWNQLEHAHYSERDRQAGYARTMRDAGLEPWIIRRRHAGVGGQELDLLLGRLMQSGDRPTALLSYAPEESTSAMLAARSLGLDVPGDLSVMTFCIGQARIGYHQVTAVGMPDSQIGHAAVQMLQTKLSHPRRQLQPQAVPSPGIVEGQTTATPQR